MASQNLPGVAVMRHGLWPAGVKLITLTGLAALVLAPFGAFALNFSAITAAICMGPGRTKTGPPATPPPWCAAASTC